MLLERLALMALLDLRVQLVLLVLTAQLDLLGLRVSKV